MLQPGVGRAVREEPRGGALGFGHWRLGESMATRSWEQKRSSDFH